jgi:hypothetical protein
VHSHIDLRHVLALDSIKSSDQPLTAPLHLLFLPLERHFGVNAGMLKKEQPLKTEAAFADTDRA